MLWYAFGTLSSYETWDALQWHHNYQPHDCLLNLLFGRRSKKHQSPVSLAFVRGIHRWPVDSPYKGPVKRKMFPFDDVIMDIYKAIWVLSTVVPLITSCNNTQFDASVLLIMNNWDPVLAIAFQNNAKYDIHIYNFSVVSYIIAWSKASFSVSKLQALDHTQSWGTIMYNTCVYSYEYSHGLMLFVLLWLNHPCDLCDQFTHTLQG